MVVTALAPLPFNTPVRVVAPVPPLPTGSVPLISGLPAPILIAPLTSILLRSVLTGIEGLRPEIATLPTTSSSC